MSVEDKPDNKVQPIAPIPEQEKEGSRGMILEIIKQELAEALKGVNNQPHTPSGSKLNDSLKEEDNKKVKRSEMSNQERENAKKSENYNKMKNALISYNAEYEKHFQAEEIKGYLDSELEPNATLFYCKVFYDKDCDFNKFCIIDRETQEEFNRLLEADEFLIGMHDYGILRKLQAHTESIVKYKKEQNVELQRESMSFLASGAIQNKKLTPNDSYNLWMRGKIDTKEFQSQCDKFYGKRFGIGYTVGN